MAKLWRTDITLELVVALLAEEIIFWEDGRISAAEVLIDFSSKYK